MTYFTFKATEAQIFKVLDGCLRELYKRTRFTVKGADWPPQQAKIFVSVALVHYKGKRTQQEYFEIAKIQKEGATAIDNFTSSTYTGSSAKKPRLDYSRVTTKITDIFAADPTDLTETSTSSTKTPKRILIEGAPGIGKTVLSKEIAYCWATNEMLTEIKIVFLLYLRDPQLQSITSTKQLVDYMSMGCLDDKQITIFTKYLVNTNGEQLCIVMDGFDEYPTSLQNNSFFVDIIKGVILCEAIVVVTSRPTATVSLHDQVDRRIDILGLPKEERENYISAIFSDAPEKKVDLDKYLKQQPVINGLCFVPLHLAILLYLFQQGSLPETLTEMNESFILHTIFRHLKRHGLTPFGPVDKLGKVPKQVLDIVYKLSELAFQGLQKNKLVFTFDEIKETCPYIDEAVGAINGFGLLQAVEHYPHKGAGTTQSFNFLHFTMQEFLAALHVSTLPSEQQSSLMKKTFWDGHYNFMWMMFVGIVGIKSEIFVNFVSNKGKVYVRKSGIRMKESILSDKRKRLHVFQCYMEAKSSAEAPDVISDMFKNGKVIIDKVKLLPHHLSSLMTFMSNSSMQWETLELTRCKITDVGMNVLEQFISEIMSTLDCVDLSGNESSPWGVYCVAIRNCCVDSLTLGGDYGMKEYVNKVTECLLNNTKFQLLKLKNITKEGFKPIFEVRTLQKLDLSNNNLSDDGAATISDGLKSNRTLLELNLSNNNLSDDGASTISDCLKSNNSLQELYMSNNKITSEGAKMVGEVIKVNTTLQKLDISQNRISDDGAATISDGLKTNRTLLEINISQNSVADKGAQEIAKAIQTNSSLQNVDISKNYISSEGLLNFMEVVKNNSSVQVVNITHNNVTRSGFENIKRFIENLHHQIQFVASWNEISNYGNLTTKIYKTCTPGIIKEDVWSFSDNDPDHIVTLLSDCLKEDDTLLVLEFLEKRITNVGAKKIGEAIQVNTTLQKLDIRGNTISDDGAAAISDGLKCNNSLQVLNISSNNITSEGAKKVGEAIKMNTTLRKLYINKNIISDVGLAAISDSLKSNNSLQELYMYDIMFTSEGAKQIAETIKVNKTLHTLHISQYSINDVLSFNMTVLTAVYHNNTLMKLWLPSVHGDDDRRLVSSEVEKINKERTRQGIRTLTCNY